jgi:hypothetical protein
MLTLPEPIQTGIKTQKEIAAKGTYNLASSADSANSTLGEAHSLGSQAAWKKDTKIPGVMNATGLVNSINPVRGLNSIGGFIRGREHPVSFKDHLLKNNGGEWGFTGQPFMNRQNPKSTKIYFSTYKEPRLETDKLLTAVLPTSIVAKSTGVLVRATKETLKSVTNEAGQGNAQFKLLTKENLTTVAAVVNKNNKRGISRKEADPTAIASNASKGVSLSDVSVEHVKKVETEKTTLMRGYIIKNPQFKDGEISSNSKPFRELTKQVTPAVPALNVVKANLMKEDTGLKTLPVKYSIEHAKVITESKNQPFGKYIVENPDFSIETSSATPYTFQQITEAHDKVILNPVVKWEKAVGAARSKTDMKLAQENPKVNANTGAIDFQENQKAIQNSVPDFQENPKTDVNPRPEFTENPSTDKNIKVEW